jgi:uncharacterized lipoprotein YajG
MKKTHAIRTLLLALAASLLAGCATSARSLPVKSDDRTAPLLQHPQFGRAAAVAPDFVNAALQTVTRLETELANKR